MIQCAETDDKRSQKSFKFDASLVARWPVIDSYGADCVYQLAIIADSEGGWDIGSFGSQNGRWIGIDDFLPCVPR